MSEQICLKMREYTCKISHYVTYIQESLCRGDAMEEHYKIRVEWGGVLFSRENLQYL